MRIPLVDIAAQHRALAAEVEQAALSVLRSGRFILGPEVEAFENELSQWLYDRHERNNASSSTPTPPSRLEAVGLSSGSDALVIALQALGVGAGDKVVTSPYTFFATAEAILRIGAEPVFGDIDPSTYHLDWTTVPASVQRSAKAAITVGLFGRNEPSRTLAAADLPLIEDSAQALGSLPLSGDLGCTSFFPAKNLGGYGDGGAVFTRHAGLAKRLRSLRVHGATARYLHEHVGGNYRLDALQAAMLRVKLRHLDAWLASRRRIAAHYGELFAAHRLPITLPAEALHHTYNQYVIRAPERDALQNALRQKGIETAVYYPRPLHQQPVMAFLGHARGAFPEAERASQETLALPMHPFLGADAQRETVEAIASFFQKSLPRRR